MDWAHAYYTRQSETFGRAIVTDHNRRAAARLDAWATAYGCGPDLLELGAGAGGLAAALADLGRRVVAIDFNPSDAAFARTLAADRPPGALTVVEGDFYTADLERTFDFVCYWDGFGIGSDADQRRLLHRIADDWLTPGGRCALDVFSPWAWRGRDGETSTYTARDGTAWTRTVRYDAVGQRFTDSWHPADDDSVTRSQSIRCYAIPDLVLLLDGTGLALDRVHAMDGSEIDPSRADADTTDMLLRTNGYVAIVRRADAGASAR